jgi:glycosyltransferase involved in cell wall biosynthesis
VRVAFYAPMKPPDHAVPSGERLMARQLVAVIGHIGHDVIVASRLRAFSQDPDRTHLDQRRRAARDEVDRLLDLYRRVDAGWRPDVWFTYHPYYKAPDLIGPPVAAALQIPYVTAESSYAPKRIHDAWGPWQQPVEAAIRSADVNLCLTARDRDAIEHLTGRRGRIVDLPPFLIVGPPAGSAAALARVASSGATIRLVTVAMMRMGDKFASYQILADALRRLARRDWTLTLVGDGEARSEVANLFDGIDGTRITWRGELEADGVAEALGAADIFVWPGVGEAYGLAYLEAAARGVPAVALRTAGVPAVVIHDRTGLLADVDGDWAGQFASALDRLICDATLRQRLGQGAHAFQRDERSLAAAAAILTGVFEGLPAEGARE